ncbi:hypothetical protein EX895_002296 [Sporisorium graminicola]|uniref:Uncharacterized protein n=1 Tax=Sporisorium graminicola TaxID=280036 RepID=A0A4U7KVG0_9BASI|nr:hypothetical protein EX895_002296 [Sporisorium graminicola]TKY88665.1 hypothetical protein EX895_002296 [Sporisorium graminicola]
MQIEDAIHVAKHGKEPPKFPEITRAAAAIGLTAAVLNVVNFLFSAKTTALATNQFSSPPTPPTLIDTAALWNGHTNTLMPLPEEKAFAARAVKIKRSIAEAVINRQLLKRHLSSESIAKGDVNGHNISRRWVVSTLVGTGLGALLAPGFASQIRGKKPEHDEPPFDPYDPAMIQPKDSFSAAAATLEQPLPALPASASTGGSAPGTSPNVDNIAYPVEASYLPVTADTRTQSLVNPSARQNLAVNPGGTYAGHASESSLSSEAQPVLRRRSVVPAPHLENGHSEAGSSSNLDKRFIFGGGGTASKVAGVATAASILPLLWVGVTHARWRTENPRDRDVIKDLDDTPTFGAVGVPGRMPGQLATNAMPGYTDYIEQLEQQQAQTQRAAQRQTDSEGGLQAAQAASSSIGGSYGGGAGGGGDPVLRRRDDQSHLTKRAWLGATALALFGGVLGYAQSATQFPSDRDEEKDQKRREAKKKQEEMMAAQQRQQQQAGYPSADGGVASGADPLADIPEKQLPGTMGGGGYSEGSTYGATTNPSTAGSGSGSSSSTTSYAGPGLGSYSPATYGSGKSDSSSTYSTGGAFTGGATGATGASSLGASLNAAAGYGTLSSSGGGGGGSVLKKRDSSTQKGHELEKRTPGAFGSALTIGGTAMFGGTLLANLYVSGKQKSKPVPLVTPNANTKGAVPPGGDLYTQYLESKRLQPAVAGAGGIGLGGGAPAAVSYGAAPLAATANTVAVSSDNAVEPISASSSDDSESVTTGALDPVLKKRHGRDVLGKRAPAATFIAAAEEAPGLLRAGTGLASVLGRGAAASETGVGAASVLGRGGAAAASEAAGAGAFSRVSAVGRGGGFSRLPESARQGMSPFGTTAAEGGFSTFARAPPRNKPFENGFAASVYRPGGAAYGAAQPAMVSEMRVATGTAGTPATIEGAAAAEAEAGAGAAQAAEGVNGKGGALTPLKAVGIVGSGAGVTMMMNGIGR